MSHKTAEDTAKEPVPPKHPIRDVEFGDAGFPREFNQAELAIYDEVATKQDLRGLEREYGTIVESRRMDSVDAKLEAAQKRVDALEKRLENLLLEMTEDLDAWDDEKLTAHEERLATEVERLKGLVEPKLQTVADSSDEDEQRVNEILQKLDEANMRIAHAIGKHHKLKVGTITEWLKDPTNDDLDNAAALVEVGVTSIPLNRAQRRARTKAGKGASSRFAH